MGEDSYGAGCWSGLFGGFLPQRPYFRRGQRRGLTFGLSAHRSFGREDDRKNRRKKRVALYPRPERRGFTARTDKASEKSISRNKDGDNCLAKIGRASCRERG